MVCRAGMSDGVAVRNVYCWVASWASAEAMGLWVGEEAMVFCVEY